MLTRSIRFRLQLWLGFLLVCLLTGFGVAVYQLQRLQQMRQVDEELARRLLVIGGGQRGQPPPNFRGDRAPGENGLRNRDPENFLRRPAPPNDDQDVPPADNPGPGPGSGRGQPPFPREFKLPAEAVALFDASQPNGFYYVIWLRHLPEPKRSANAPELVPRPEENGHNLQLQIRQRGEYREAFRSLEGGGCFLVGRSTLAEEQARERLAGLLFLAGAGLLAIGLGGGWWLTTRAIRPVEEISAAASRISAGNLSERITVAEPENEIGRLAGVLNATFSRLESAFLRQKQFTADASHELRTPLAVIISETQTTLARERSAAEYRETVEACLETAQQMRQLTESLLHLARADAESGAPTDQVTDLATIVRVCGEQLQPLAEKHGLKVHYDLAPLHVAGPAERHQQIIFNLLGNAIHYNRPQGEIRLRLHEEKGKAVLTVADTGQGIAAEDLPHIFERFYRADQARSLTEGRTGLGLAICHAVVQSLGGEILVVSELAAGTTFTVRLPLAGSGPAYSGGQK